MDATLPLTPNNTVQNRKVFLPQSQKELRQKSSFDVFIYDKGPVLLGAAVGAATGYFGTTPIAKYFVKRSVDESLNVVSQRADDIKSIFFKDLSKKEFLKTVERLQKDQVKAEEIATVISSKIPESLKIMGLDEEQSKVLIEKNIEPVINWLKNMELKKLTPEQIEEIRLKSTHQTKEFFEFIGNSLNIKGKDSDETVKIIRDRIIKKLDIFGKKSQNALNPIKDKLIDKYIKATVKYKVIASVLCGLSLAGIVSIVKPLPKKSEL